MPLLGLAVAVGVLIKVNGGETRKAVLFAGGAAVLLVVAAQSSDVGGWLYQLVFGGWA